MVHKHNLTTCDVQKLRTNLDGGFGKCFDELARRRHIRGQSAQDIGLTNDIPGTQSNKVDVLVFGQGHLFIVT